MRSFVATAIAESSTIISYQHEMIFCHPEGGVVKIIIAPRYLYFAMYIMVTWWNLTRYG